MDHSPQMTYFATDGNYGDAEGIVIIDTQSWTEDEWTIIDETPDRQRASVALSLSKSNDDQLELFK